MGAGFFKARAQPRLESEKVCRIKTSRWMEQARPRLLRHAHARRWTSSAWHIPLTFQYASRADEVPPAQPGEQSRAPQPAGDAVSAAQSAATYLQVTADSSRLKPW